MAKDIERIIPGMKQGETGLQPDSPNTFDVPGGQQATFAGSMRSTPEPGNPGLTDMLDPLHIFGGKKG